MTITRRRVARKRHICFGCTTAHGPIQPGEAYLEHTAFPGCDNDYADVAGHPFRAGECADCATRYGRAHLLNPTTEETP
ncbi:hypothetical protein F8M49_20675 [Rhodococcus zopfii]|uniref:Uncharacterized protein n=1 Tax=Rhodococcus zopfii TaxID=43772 RepID=A0ABU3WT87_9NOCA|nr:hypothetical protein [Rhodococcus zopfii]